VPHTLLRSQENQVFESIQAAELDPAEFEWLEDNALHYTEGGLFAKVPMIGHRASGSYFIFDFERKNSRTIVTYSPGLETPSETHGTSQWHDVMIYLALWLTNLKREHFAPDLWAELEKQRELTAALEPSGGDADNTPFTPDEQSAIAAQLNEIKELFIRTETLDGDRLATLEAGVAYLVDASTRMGRRDWLTVYYGTVFGWALNGLVSPDGARQALMTAAHALGHIFGHPMPQLPS
jgi:hypothetical protein